MEYELYTFINYAGVVIIVLIMLYHFLNFESNTHTIFYKKERDANEGM